MDQGSGGKELKCFRDGASSLDGCRLQDGLQRPPLESLTSTLYIYATSLDSSRSQTPNLNLNLSLEAVYTSKTLNPNASCRSAASHLNYVPRTKLEAAKPHTPNANAGASIRGPLYLKTCYSETGDRAEASNYEGNP